MFSSARGTWLMTTPRCCHLAMRAEFLHHHGVGAGRHRRAGKDARRRTRLQGGADGAGGNALADRQADAGSSHVGAAHGITIHRRIVERRDRYGRPLGNGQNAASGGRQGLRANFLDRLGGGEQFFQGLFKTQHGRSCNWRVVITKPAMAATSSRASRGRLVAISASVATATMSLRSGNNGGLPFSGR